MQLGVMVLFSVKTYPLYDENHIQYIVVICKRTDDEVVEERGKTR